MKSIRSKKQSGHIAIAIALCLAATTSLAYAEDDEDENQAPTENTKEFLSDPSRVGSLTGTILGGALTAHPVGTVAGSIIGFFVGKQSMFKSPEKERMEQLSRAPRSIIPNGSDAFASNASQAMMPGLQGHTYGQQGTAMQQIATYCSGNKSSAKDPILQTLCYYRQSS
jgi:hypothetical protein